MHACMSYVLCTIIIAGNFNAANFCELEALGHAHEAHLLPIHTRLSCEMYENLHYTKISHYKMCTCMYVCTYHVWRLMQVLILIVKECKGREFFLLLPLNKLLI